MNVYQYMHFQLLGELYEDREYLEKLLNDSRKLICISVSIIGVIHKGCPHKGGEKGVVKSGRGRGVEGKCGCPQKF